MALSKGQLTFEKEDQLHSFIQNQHTERASEEDERNLSLDDIKVYQRMVTGEEDYSLPEITQLKRELCMQCTGEVFKLLKEYPALVEVPVYRIFGMYLSIWHCNKSVYTYLYEKQGDPSYELHSFDQEAFNLFEKYSFDQLKEDEEQCRTILTELVVYRALDFNIREIFSHGFKNYAQIKLRRSDALTLIKYRHYQEIILTFDKPIRRSLLKIFYDKDFHIAEEEHYSKYCLNFYIELMLGESFSNQEVLQFIEKIGGYFEVDQAMHVFIRRDNLELLKWGETQKDFAFTMQYFGLALNYEAFDIMFYYCNQHSRVIKNNRNQIPAFTISSLQKSPQVYLSKFNLIQAYFKSFQVEHCHDILQILSHKYYSSISVDNPFLYTWNPVRLGLFQISLLRQIRKKYKSLEVKCLELEQYLEQSILTFLDQLNDISVIHSMLQDQVDGMSAIFLLNQLSIYSIIQHRNVQEVIFSVYQSEYSIEAWPIEEFSIVRMLFLEDTLQDVDYENKYRFHNLTLKLDNAKQSSMMFHIWKKSSYVRLNIEFLSIILFALVFQYAMINFTSASSEMLKSLVALMNLAEIEIDYSKTDAFTSSVFYYHCTEIEEEMLAMYKSTIQVETFFYIQVLFLYKLFLDYVFLEKTGRKYYHFFNSTNIMMTLLGCLGLTYAVYSLWFKSDDIIFADHCRIFGGYDDDLYQKTIYLNRLLPKQDFLQRIFSLNIIFMWALIILQLRQVQMVGTLLKIIFGMVIDFLKMIVIQISVMAVYILVGFILFTKVQQFQNIFLTFQLLFDASVGEFDFEIFDEYFRDDIEIDYWITIETMGRIYLISYVVFQHILTLNLLIAIFSYTYSNLWKIGDGLYLKDIIEIIPSKYYDKYYSGMVSCPFPFSLFLLPLQTAYLFVRSRTYNENVLIASHFITNLFLMVPTISSILIVILPLAYLKALVSKVYLIARAKNCKNLARRVLELFIFLVAGLILLLLNTILDFAKQIQILTKAEETLSFRNKAETIKINPADIEKFAVLCKSGKLPKRSYTKEMVTMVSEDMQISKKISQLALGIGNEEEILESLKSFSRLKQFLVDNSILENQDLFIHSPMLKGVVNDISLGQYYTDIIKEKKKKKAHKSNAESGLKQQEKEREKKSYALTLMFNARVGYAQKAFVVEKTLCVEDQTLNIAHQTIEKTIGHITNYVQKHKRKVLQCIQ